MDLSLRLDTLGMVEVRYLRNRERYRDWPAFQLSAASRQATIMAFMTRDVAEQLHQQILIVEAAVGLDGGTAQEEDEEDFLSGDDLLEQEEPKASERESSSSSFSPALAQALDQLNKLARQRLPEGSTSGSDAPPLSGHLSADHELSSGDEEDALEQLQDAFVQMMEVVRELAEEMSTDALKLTGRFRCARTNIEFIQAEAVDEEDEDEDEDEDGIISLEVELVMVLQLFEEGRAKVDDLPAVELQLDVDDFERLHDTLDIALEHERRSRRRK